MGREAGASHALMDKAVEIVPYRPGWPAEFRQIGSILRSGLGDLAIRIDHIGSTSVPDLAAKDVIDIQITVTALDDRLILAMAALGYSLPEGVWRDHRPPNFVGSDAEWEKLYFRPPPGQRRTHVHVRVQGRAEPKLPALIPGLLTDAPGYRQRLCRAQTPISAKPG